MPLAYVPPGQATIFSFTGLKPDGWEWLKDHTQLENSGLYVPRDVLVCPACVLAEKETEKAKSSALKLVK